jgi:large subunit ribosomal protein L3
VVVNGAVSGPKGGLVMISDAIKKPWPQVPPPSKPAEASKELRRSTGAQGGPPP